MEKAKVCIVTVDTIGPVTNGGIGTACFALAKELAKDSRFDVSLLYTGDFPNGSYPHWKQYYKEFGIQFLALHSETKPNFLIREFLEQRSAQVFDFLLKNYFNVVHFQDWQSDGFASIRGKKMGLGLEDTILTVTLHSPGRWQREGMRMWSGTPVSDLKQDFREQYCCENADYLMSPSQHMFDWAKEKQWNVQDEKCVLAPYCSPRVADQPTVDKSVDIDPKHLVFFGRLETRKGIEIFCEAVAARVEEAPDSVREISFFGKFSRAEGMPSDVYLEQFAAKVPGVKIHTHTGFDSFTALQKIRETCGIVFMPSLLDNYPLAVIECIEQGLPFFTAATGGIPEMVDAKSVFEATARGILLKLREIGEGAGFIKDLKHKYDSVAAGLKWKEVSTRVPARIEKPVGENPLPKVSVVICYYNLGEFLPATLDALDKNSYGNFEVIVVNDGSTNKSSIKVFEEQAKLRGKHYKFISQDNAGPGTARNCGAALASGEYLIFVDADNVPGPTMVDDLVRGIQYSGCDVVTCYFKAFEGDFDETTWPVYTYQPLGACLEVGLFENCFGDTNFIISTEAFRELGGFPTDRGYAHEDWEILARTVLSGKKLDVLPKFTFWYRHRADSHLRVTSRYHNRSLVLRPYLATMPPHIQRVIFDATLPLSFQHDFGRVYRVARTLAQLISRYPILKKVSISAFDVLNKLRNLSRRLRASSVLVSKKV